MFSQDTALRRLVTSSLPGATTLYLEEEETCILLIPHHYQRHRKRIQAVCEQLRTHVPVLEGYYLSPRLCVQCDLQNDLEMLQAQKA